MVACSEMAENAAHPRVCHFTLAHPILQGEHLYGSALSWMDCVGLSALQRGWDIQTCVCVSRLWHYRGGLEAGPVNLMHMILVDEQGDHGYAVVPTFVLNSYLELVHEGKVYEFSQFPVFPRQPILNPTEAPSIIVFT